MPVYNNEKLLPNAVNSIINQMFSDWELIIVDDGSTDNSSEICDEYARNDERIVVIHKENKGVSSARNKGI
ncbi:MAG: glycosyltransferase family 2 protein [Oscillospiraceae bacterium]|nr:glycosyltransferase family 2 protein [Oscillospiraceae bacterium]